MGQGNGHGRLVVVPGVVVAGHRPGAEHLGLAPVLVQARRGLLRIDPQDLFHAEGVGDGCGEGPAENQLVPGFVLLLHGDARDARSSRMVRIMTIEKRLRSMTASASRRSFMVQIPT